MIDESVLDTDIYCITAEEYSQGRNNIEVVKEMIEADVDIIQYRAKNKKMLDKYHQAKKIRQLTKQAEVKLIINDNIDLALAVDADGVHIGQEDMPVGVVRNLISEEKIIGLSTHSPQQAKKAEKLGVDYIGVGPIFPTNTKVDVCAPVGLDYLEYVVNNIDLPFVAIGGIKEHNIKEVVAKGAQTVSLVTGIVAADNIKTKIKSIRKKMNT